MLPFVNNLMPFRYQHLEQTLKGYQMTGVPLIEYNGTSFLPAGISDDTGIYYFVPKIAQIFNTNLDQSIFLFFFGIFIFSIIPALFFIWKNLKTYGEKILAIVFLSILSVYLFLRGDIYILSATTSLLVIPLCYLTAKQSIPLFWKYGLYSFFGIIIILSNFIRSNSATGILLFLFVFIIISFKQQKKQLFYLVIFLVAGMIIGKTWTNFVKSERDDFLITKGIKSENIVEGHVFWHSVYLGLGFLNNNYGIIYNDGFAYTKCAQVSPKTVIHSEEYENVIKKEVFKLIKNDPWFIIKTVSAKFGVVLFYLVLFSNIGLYFISKRIKDYAISIPMSANLLFNLSFPLAVMPFPGYLVGAVSSILLFSIIAMNNSENKIESSNFSDFFKK